MYCSISCWIYCYKHSLEINSLSDIYLYKVFSLIFPFTFTLLFYFYSCFKVVIFSNIFTKIFLPSFITYIGKILWLSILFGNFAAIFLSQTGLKIFSQQLLSLSFSFFQKFSPICYEKNNERNPKWIVRWSSRYLSPSNDNYPTWPFISSIFLILPLLHWITLKQILNNIFQL